MFPYLSPSLFLSQRNVSDEKFAHVLLVQASVLHTYYSLYLRFSRFSTPHSPEEYLFILQSLAQMYTPPKNCFLTSSVYDICAIFVFCTRCCRGIDANIVCLHICLPWQTVNSVIGTIFTFVFLCLGQCLHAPSMMLNERMHACLNV